MSPKKPPKEDAGIQALFQQWLSNPTNSYHLKNLAEGMVEWEIKARMKRLPEVTA